jgi:hypothetical protein
MTALAKGDVGAHCGRRLRFGRKRLGLLRLVARVRSESISKLLLPHWRSAGDDYG